MNEDRPFFSNLKCRECGRLYEKEAIHICEYDFGPLEAAYDYTGDMQWTIKRGAREKRKTFPKGDQFAAEMDYFSQCVLKNRQPEPSGAEGLADIRIIRAIDEAARRGRSVKLKPFRKTKRPGPRQEIKRPPVKRQPDLVKVAAPGG